MDILMKSDKFQNLKKVIKPHNKSKTGNSLPVNKNTKYKNGQKSNPLAFEFVSSSSINYECDQPLLSDSLNQRNSGVRDKGQHSTQKPLKRVESNAYPMQKVESRSNLSTSQVLSSATAYSLRQGLDPNISRSTFVPSEPRPNPHNFMKDNSGFLIPQRTNTFKPTYQQNNCDRLEKDYITESNLFLDEINEVQTDYYNDKFHSYIMNIIKKKQVATNVKPAEVSSWIHSKQDGNYTTNIVEDAMSYPSFNDASRLTLKSVNHLAVNHPAVNHPAVNHSLLNYPLSNMQLVELLDMLRLNPNVKVTLLKDWTVVRSDNSDLFLSGKLFDMHSEELLEDRHISSKIVKRINCNAVATIVCTYILQGQFMDSNDDIPKEIRSIFKNDGFPSNWKSLAIRWGEMSMSHLPRTSSLQNNTVDNYQRSEHNHRKLKHVHSSSNDSSSESDSKHGTGLYEARSQAPYKRKPASDDMLGNMNKRHKECPPEKKKRVRKVHEKAVAHTSTLNFTMQLRSHSKSAGHSQCGKVTNRQRTQSTNSTARRKLITLSDQTNCQCVVCTPKFNRIRSRKQTPGHPKMSEQMDSMLEFDSE